ncbi:hypothetical protein IKG20_01155 [Candidatus Saccharibacteria bacterium]|nr:hypothetical protein [Candidatus Saccharibacteria bacterium]
MREFRKEIFDKFPSPKANEEVVSKYEKQLKGATERNLFRASIRIVGAQLAGPGVNLNLKLRVLSKDDDSMKQIAYLVHNYTGISDILETFGEYFALESKPEFWSFFNKRLELPNDWLTKMKEDKLIDDGSNWALELIKKYDKEEYDSFFRSDKVAIEDHLNRLMERYTPEELEAELKNNPKFTRI